MAGLMNEALRWIFWGVVYLAISLTAVVVLLGYAAPYLNAPTRWAMLGVFFWGIALDVVAKRRGDSTRKPTPPSGGELQPIEARNR